MAFVKISELPAASSAAGTDELEANQSGTSRKVTAAQLRAGLAASGANSDITSLTGLTTALSVAQGGTGATAASGARAALLPSYTGNAGRVLAVNSGGTDAEWVPFTSSPEVETPTNVSPTNAATDIGETPTLTGSAFRSLYGKAQKSSQWQISTVSNFASTVYDSGEVVAVGVTRSVPAATLSTSTTYYWRVRYRDESDAWSAYSTATTFTTASGFNNFIATPDAVPSIGTSHQGGFYFGQIWDEITQSSTSTAIGTGSKTFTVTNAAPLFYSGQQVRVVSRGAAGGRVMEGTVTASSGTTLTVNVTAVTGSGTYTDWSVLIRYRLIIAPKSSGENASVQYKNANTAAPTATQTLTNGRAATAGMVAADTSTVYPLAHWAAARNIGGFTDWYVPARDELELIWRNLKPTTTNNWTGDTRPKSSIAYTAGGNQDDVSGDGHGVNRHSNPTAVAYTASVPGQTSVTAFRTGGAEALEFGSAYYWSSSEFSSSTAWSQNYSTGIPGYQGNGSKSGNGRARAVRRSPV